jgi:hypothetical protein
MKRLGVWETMMNVSAIGSEARRTCQKCGHVAPTPV